MLSVICLCAGGANIERERVERGGGGRRGGAGRRRAARRAAAAARAAAVAAAETRSVCCPHGHVSNVLF